MSTKSGGSFNEFLIYTVKIYMNKEILVSIEQYVTDCFLKDTPDFLKYHNLDHTRAVVGRSGEIARHYALPEEDMLTLLAAAWFHDLGYLYAPAETHEEKGVAMMQEFLFSACLPEILAQIKVNILTTKSNAPIATLQEKILCDADTYHLGTDEFFASDELVKRETELRTGLDEIPGKAWISQTLMLLKKHLFHTDYCSQLLEHKKRENMEMLESMRSIID